MTLTDAMNLASLRGLEATEEHGFCVLRHHGGGIATRGGTFEEAFARLEAADTVRPLRRPDPEPPAQGRLF